MENLQVQGAPAIYQCYPGVLKKLPEKLAEMQNLHRGLVIHGEKSWNAVNVYFDEVTIPFSTVRYRGECTHEEVARINRMIKENKVDFIIGAGGGKVMDIAKACGNALDLPVVLIPTLASNCAAWTPLSVFYDQEGNFVEHIIFPKSNFMVLVDPEVIIDSPVAFLRAGIGDTIAKWYEADVLFRKLSYKPIPLEICLHAAALCRNVLLENGKEAISSLENREITNAFLHTIETIILAGGMVGGYGDQYGRIAGAHSVHNALTQIPETHTYLHGEKVAYGILVQLAIEKQPEEIDFLLPYYNQLRLPVSLAELGIVENAAKAVDTISTYTVKPGESIHLMDVSSKEEVQRAIDYLERHISTH